MSDPTSGPEKNTDPATVPCRSVPDPPRFPVKQCRTRHGSLSVSAGPATVPCRTVMRRTVPDLTLLTWTELCRTVSPSETPVRPDRCWSRFRLVDWHTGRACLFTGSDGCCSLRLIKLIDCRAPTPRPTRRPAAHQKTIPFT